MATFVKAVEWDVAALRHTVLPFRAPPAPIQCKQLPASSRCFRVYSHVSRPRTLASRRFPTPGLASTETGYLLCTSALSLLLDLMRKLESNSTFDGGRAAFTTHPRTQSYCHFFAQSGRQGRHSPDCGPALGTRFDNTRQLLDSCRKRVKNSISPTG